MTTIKKPEQERTEASPPLRSINEPSTTIIGTDTPPSINEPPRQSNDSHEKSPQATDVSRETRPEPDHGNKRHR